MSFVTWKVIHTPYNAGYDSTGASDTEITDAFSSSFVTSLGSSRDSFNFSVNNSHSRYDNYFNPRDKITLYRAINSAIIDTDTDLLAIGVITDTPQTVDSRSNILKIKGNNYSELIMDAIIFTTPAEAGQTIPEAINQGLKFIQLASPSNPVIWSATNDTVMSDGNLFPVLTENFYDKPIRQLIEKYSTNQYTTDGRYYWYVDRNNEFIWKKEETETVNSFDFDTDTDFTKYIVKKDTSDVINYVIIKGGFLPNGVEISESYQDFTSSAKYGIKYHYMVDDKNFVTFVNARDMASLGAEAEDGKLPSAILGSSYNKQFEWMQYSGIPAATSDRDYISKLKVYVKSFLKKKAKEVVDYRSNGKLTVDITFRAGVRSWGIGDLIAIKAPNISATPGITAVKPLRVQSISYSEGLEVYSLSEDIGTF